MKVNEPKLKLCPFCNSDKLKIDCKSKKAGYNGLDHPVYLRTYSVRCNRCHARGGAVGGKVLSSLPYPYPLPDWATTDKELENKAIEAWNKRATSSKEEALEPEYEGDGFDDNGEIIYDMAYCPICHQQYEIYYDNHDNYCRNCGQKLDWSRAEQEDV